MAVQNVAIKLNRKYMDAYKYLKTHYYGIDVDINKPIIITVEQLFKIMNNFKSKKMKVNLDNEKSSIGLEKKEAKRILELFNNNAEYSKTFVHELIRLIDDYKKSNFYINVLNHI